MLRLGTALGAMLMLTVAVPAQAGTVTVFGITGTAFGPFETDTILVTLDVRGEGTAARGPFRILHVTPTGMFANLRGDIDCITGVPGAQVTVTGTIREGFDGLGINPVGHRVSIVYGYLDHRSLSLDVSFVSGHPIPPARPTPSLQFPSPGETSWSARSAGPETRNAACGRRRPAWAGASPRYSLGWRALNSARGASTSRRVSGSLIVFLPPSGTSASGSSRLSCVSLMPGFYPAQRWIPHSVRSEPAQRPERGSSPAATGKVQGWQPTDR